jgi:hypothetical protein
LPIKHSIPGVWLELLIQPQSSSFWLTWLSFVLFTQTFRGKAKYHLVVVVFHSGDKCNVCTSRCHLNTHFDKEHVSHESSRLQIFNVCVQPYLFVDSVWSMFTSPHESICVSCGNPAWHLWGLERGVPRGTLQRRVH